MRKKAEISTDYSQQSFLFPLIISFFYLAIHFIPHAGGVDPMGVQWLYLSLVNCAGLLYIFYKRTH
ncbi:MAG: hypothetical protein RLZZ28_1358, partial [Bacteroidota bacterium]